MVNIGKHFKSVQRRIHDIEYTETKLLDNFEVTEDRYRKIRDLLSIYEGNLQFLIHYEHGGKTMKALVEGVNAISSKIKEGLISTENFYLQTSASIKNIADLTDSKNGLLKYSKATKETAEAKHEMNEKLKALILKVKKIASDSEAIDEKRIDLKNVRYDLEKLKKTNSESEKITVMENEFNSLMETVLADMVEFIEEKKLSDFFVEVARAEALFHIKAYDAMNSVG